MTKKNRNFLNGKFDFWEELGMIVMKLMAAIWLPFVFILCIILEEGSKMNNKILGAAATAIFCNCLIMSACIQGKTVPETKMQETQLQKATVVKENDAVIAGVSLVLSRSSFTTESDEKASIKRNETVRVAVPENTVIEETEQVETNAEQTGENRWGINLTEEEINLLANIVWLESNGEPELGQQAVVEVIFNRMASELFPNTLYDVLSQKNPIQFCSWKNRERAKPTEKEYRSIEQVLNGNTNILRNNTFYFSREALTSNLDTRIGEHSFCY